MTTFHITKSHMIFMKKCFYRRQICDRKYFLAYFINRTLIFDITKTLIQTFLKMVFDITYSHTFWKKTHIFRNNRCKYFVGKLLVHIKKGWCRYAVSKPAENRPAVCDHLPKAFPFGIYLLIMRVFMFSPSLAVSDSFCSSRVCKDSEASRVAILFALFTVTSPIRVFADSAVAEEGW